MALTVTEIRQELTTLRHKKIELERKIQGLEHYLGQETEGGRVPATTGVSARGGTDIRPVVQTIFEANANAPLRVKEIVDRVATRLPDMARAIVEKKMVHVKRTLLSKGLEYGTYRLKTDSPPAAGAEAG